MGRRAALDHPLRSSGAGRASRLRHRPRAALTGAERRAAPGRRRGAEADRQLRQPRLRHRRARLPEAALRRRAAAARCEVLRGGHELRPALPRHPRPGRLYGGERGLLSIAFPPDYAQSGRFYVYYTDDSGNIRVDEFQRRSATRAARGSRRAVIEIPHPVNANHNGGQLQFLGDLLYFGTGDGGSGGDPPNNAQNKESLLGKLLRIDPRPSGGRPYSVPAANPFVGRAGRDEIYSYGLRNPFRFSFDTRQRPAAADRDRRRRPEPLRGARLHHRRRRRRRQLRLGRLRGLRPLRRRKQRHPGPRRHDQADLRLQPQPRRRQLLDHRRLRGRRPAARPRCAAATSTPTSARASCAASFPTCTAPAAIARLGLDVASPTSFGEDDRGRHLRRLAGGARVPARPRR